MTNPKPLGTKLDSGTIPNGWRGFGFVHRSRTLFCRDVPNPYLTIRNFFIAERRGGAAVAAGGYTLALQFRCEHAPPSSGLTAAASLLLETRAADGWSDSVRELAG
jgi:hypothetical protein